MSPCPVCSQPVDPRRSRAVAVRNGKVIAYCSKECLAVAQKDGGVTGAIAAAAARPSPLSPPAHVATPSTGVPVRVGAAASGPVIEIASTAPAKRDDTIGTWAIGDDTAVRKYGEHSTAEHEALPPGKKSRAGLVILLLLLLSAGGFGVYHYVIRG
ncbi:MAG TPA: hypothetical protein VFQ65_34085 [Kofleriaceae bacterium]|nr:hypothetical protein [Kofleriaceae bacterium]